MIIARQSTARTVMVGPVLDADGVAVTNGVVADFEGSVNGGDPAALNGSATLTHRGVGFYSLALTATDLGTVGSFQVTINDTVNACPKQDITVIEEAVYDGFFAAAALGYIANAPVNVAQIGADTQSATDLKDFADAGYDPSTNKVQGVVLTDTLTTYTGNTVQTGDSFARIGAAGASLSAVPWNASWYTEVQSEVDDALVAQNLDHLVKIAVDTNFATTVHADSVIGQIADNGAGFDRTTDSLEMLRDNLATASALATAQTSIDDLPTNAELATSQGTADDATLAAIATLQAFVDTEVAAIQTVTDKLDDTLEDDGGTYRFTTNALEQAPTGGSAPTAAAIADAVWDEDTTGHTTAGTFGEQLKTDVDAILADTAELQTDWVDGGRLDLILDARASQTSVDDLPTNAELATSQAAADDATLAAIAAVSTKVDVIDDFLDTEIADILTDTGTTLDDFIDGEVAAIKTKTDQLTFTEAGKVDANVKSINSTPVIGDGSATPWGP